MSRELTIQDLQPKEIMKITASTGLVPRELQPYVQPALEEFRNEMAAELGLTDYAEIDKGELPSRLNGKVGGSMTKKMVTFAEAVLAWNYRNNKMLAGK
ncbi:alpha/beta-type small acid-soluble spore protein [Desulfolucanica intricata]|uniref:alpha/beta-type small acid-soluble spore protein n=1 Tax=Desulfolucanica intricata TaxID=1285191 RepID=UPI00082A409E|nr:alpha/beta-type small acid-soluble spore protein [Desulfolucanica intricata]